MRFPYLIGFFLMLLQFSAKAQNDMFQRLNIPVSLNGQAIKKPWAGGLNNPQLSQADLNNDGVKDLVAFDRGGDVLLTFLNDNKPGEASYTYAPEYACNFPKLIDWVLMRDYNQDGAADIFCGSLAQSSQEVQVFRGYFENNMLKFTPFVFTYPGCPNCDPLVIWYPDDMPGFWNNMPISKTDIPAIDDIDGDGDLDILAFPAGTSTNISYWKNVSVEQGFGLDSLKFQLVDQCWGRFYENGFEPCEASLSCSPDTCGPCSGFAPEQIPEDRDNAHPGATLTTYDQEGDGDKDLIFGNISYSCLGMLTNGGTPQQAWMTALDDSFPIYDIRVDLANFPASFYLDLDNDGKKDLVAVPNNKTVGEDQKNLWFYKNTASSGHAFELETKRFLVDDMLDLGTATHPAFADVNGDGLLDLVVGNYGYFTPTSPSVLGSPNNASLYLFLNTGTPTQPAFNLVNSNWLNMAQFTPNDYDFAPTFGDIDADGDLDLLVGSNGGALYCYRNEAGAGNPMMLVQDFNTMWSTMDIGVTSTPVILDLDGDGLLDVVMGERQGNINFYKNTGSIFDPMFASLPTVSTLGGVDTDSPGQSIGFSTPFFVPTQTGYFLVTGTQAGTLEAYDNLSATSTPYSLISENWGNVDDGARSHPALADIDEDGILEMVVGNLRGGLTMYKTQLVDCTVATHEKNLSPLEIGISPNPATNWARITVPTDQDVQWRIYNTLGQNMAQGKSRISTFSIDVKGWTSGVYFLEVIAGGRRGNGRLMVKYQN